MVNEVVSDVDNLLYKIIFEEGLERTLFALQQPMKPTPIIKRDEFSDPMFARKMQALKKTNLSSVGIGHIGNRAVKKIIKKVENVYEAIQ